MGATKMVEDQKHAPEKLASSHNRIADVSTETGHGTGAARTVYRRDILRGRDSAESSELTALREIVSALSLRCEDVRPRLVDYHVGDLPSVFTDTMDRHLGGCPECRLKLAALKQSLALIADRVRVEEVAIRTDVEDHDIEVIETQLPVVSLTADASIPLMRSASAKASNTKWSLKDCGDLVRLDSSLQLPVSDIVELIQDHTCWLVFYDSFDALQDRDSDWFKHVLSGLGCGVFVTLRSYTAHDCDKPGLVHRDIKPENILLRIDDDTLAVDWGLATTVDRDGTAWTLMPSRVASGGVGTSTYMSPERFKCEAMPTEPKIVGTYSVQLMNEVWNQMRRRQLTASDVYSTIVDDGLCFSEAAVSDWLDGQEPIPVDALPSIATAIGLGVREMMPER